MQSSINIIIRSDSQKHPDLKVTISPDATIAELKSKIEQHHPATPKASLQKLIYDGKILNNLQQVNAVVKESDVVIHLVYIANSYCQTSQSARQPETMLRNRLPTRVPMSAFDLQQEHQPYTQTYNAWMQQYALQYHQYMQYYYGLQDQNAGFYPLPAQNDAAPENNVAAPNQAIQDQEQLPNMEAGLAVVDDDGQDWLDALFSLTRLMLMLSIIYFYSTTFKFVIAMVLLLIVHLYQNGFFQVNRRPALPQQNPNNPQDLTEDEAPDDNNNNSEDNSNNEDVRPPPSLFATVVCFIRSFFSSLIPTGPPGVVN